MSERRRLPMRRMAVALELEYGGHRFRLQIGRYADGALQQLLGPGGAWIDQDGQRHDKLQLHWRLGKPAIGEQLAQLKQVRDMAMRVVGGAHEQARTVTRRRLPSGFGDARHPALFAEATP